jgi:hypothetical protein
VNVVGVSGDGPVGVRFRFEASTADFIGLTCWSMVSVWYSLLHNDVDGILASSS